MEKKRSIFYRIRRVEPAISLGQWLYDRIVSNWERLALLFATWGGLSYLASITDWVKSYGPFGIAFIGLTAALVVWILLSLAGLIREVSSVKNAEAEAKSEWKKSVDYFNPLSKEFHKIRFKILDLANPITHKIYDKTITGCEIIGPGNIFLERDNTLDGIKFIRCDFVATKHHFRAYNLIGLTKVKMIDCEIYKCTIFVQPDRVDDLEMKTKLHYISLTENVEINQRMPTLDDIRNTAGNPTDNMV